MEDEYKTKSYVLYRMVPFSMTLSDPNPSFKVTLWLKGKHLANGASDPLHVWFYARVFGVGGSNGAISGSIISKMAADGHFGTDAILEI